MFCSKCGVQNSDEAKFCKGCGQQTGNNSTTASATQYSQPIVTGGNPPKRVAVYALAPIGFFVFLVILWGIVNLVSDTTNPTPAYEFFNNTLIPLLFALSFIAIPIGVIYAIYSNSKNFDGTGVIKCGNCGYLGVAKKGRRTLSQVLAWMAIIIFWPITLIYHLVTHKYLCPKCGSSFLGVRNKDGAFTAPSGGIGPLAIVLVVILVIAIIGILASVVLASLNSARDKGQDASTKSALTTARAQAELFYDNNFNSYDGVCNDQKVKTVLSNAKNSQLVAPTCNDSSVYYAISAPLSSGNHFCVDSYGNSVIITSPLKYETICPKGVEDTLN